MGNIKLKYTSDCCQKCGEHLGWLGRFMEFISFGFFGHFCAFRKSRNVITRMVIFEKNRRGYKRCMKCRSYSIIAVGIATDIIYDKMKFYKKNYYHCVNGNCMTGFTKKEWDLQN